MQLGKVYQVSENIKFSFNGVPCYRDGFYMLIGKTMEGVPVFQDGNKFFAAKENEFTITPLKEEVSCN